MSLRTVLTIAVILGGTLGQPVINSLTQSNQRVAYAQVATPNPHAQRGPLQPPGATPPRPARAATPVPATPTSSDEARKAAGSQPSRPASRQPAGGLGGSTARPTANYGPSGPSGTPPSAPPTRTYLKSYGAHTFAADALWVTTAALANSDTGEMALWGYVFAGGLVHSLHGNGTGALYSIGLRVGLPLLGVTIGFGLEEDDCGRRALGCDGTPALIGAGLGALTALVIDWTVLSKKTVTLDTMSATGPHSKRGFSIMPQFAPTRGGAQLGVVGAF